MFNKKEIVLQQASTKQGSTTVTAKLNDNGDLRIDGHDLTTQGQNIFGTSEYEWIILVKAGDLPALQTALKTNRKILPALKNNFSGDKSATLKPFLEQHNIPFKFSNRMGD